MKKQKLKNIIKKVVKESKKLLLEIPGACNPPFMSGGEGNACGVGGDCSGTLETVYIPGMSSAACLCKAPNHWTIQGGTDEFCPQGGIDTPGFDDPLDMDAGDKGFTPGSSDVNPKDIIRGKSASSYELGRGREIKEKFTGWDDDEGWGCCCRMNSYGTCIEWGCKCGGHGPVARAEQKTNICHNDPPHEDGTCHRDCSGRPCGPGIDAVREAETIINTENLLTTIKSSIDKLKSIKEQSGPATPGPNGYSGGINCFACINYGTYSTVEERLFPQAAVTTTGECAPTGYGWQGHPTYALPGGTQAYAQPSIWSTGNAAAVYASCPSGSGGSSQQQACQIPQGSGPYPNNFNPANWTDTFENNNQLSGGNACNFLTNRYNAWHTQILSHIQAPPCSPKWNNMLQRKKETAIEIAQNLGCSTSTWPTSFQQ